MLLTAHLHDELVHTLLNLSKLWLSMLVSRVLIDVVMVLLPTAYLHDVDELVLV